MPKPSSISLDVRRRQMLLGALAVCGGLVAGRRVLAADSATSAPMSGDEHMHHHHHTKAGAEEGTKRSEMAYELPVVNMLRSDGSKAQFPKEIDDGRPVILNFMYTSCTAICPVTTQVFSQVQSKLGADAAKVHMVSISIDPEYDTPARLAEYAKKYGAGKDWQFYTGTVDASIALQKAFDAYRGDKMNHVPVTYLRAAPGKPWVRLDGFAKPDEVVGEYHHAAHGG